MLAFTPSAEYRPVKFFIRSTRRGFRTSLCIASEDHLSAGSSAHMAAVFDDAPTEIISQSRNGWRLTRKNISPRAAGYTLCFHKLQDSLRRRDVSSLPAVTAGDPVQDYYRVLTGRQTGLRFIVLWGNSGQTCSNKISGHQLDSRYRQVAVHVFGENEAVELDVSGPAPGFDNFPSPVLMSRTVWNRLEQNDQ